MKSLARRIEVLEAWGLSTPPCCPSGCVKVLPETLSGRQRASWISLSAPWLFPGFRLMNPRTGCAGQLVTVMISFSVA